MRAQLVPQLQLPPRLLPDPTPHLATTADVYPEPAPRDTRTPGARLLDLRVELIRGGTPPEKLTRIDSLLSRYYSLEEEIAQVEHEERMMRIVRLEQRFAELTQKCRAAKDRLDQCQIEIATINSRLSAHQSGKLRAAKELAADVEAQRPKEGNFPTPQETESWIRRHANAKSQLESASGIHQELAREAENARISQQVAAHDYNKAVGEYETAKAELKNMQKQN
jgi:hypothetical protein